MNNEFHSNGKFLTVVASYGNTVVLNGWNEFTPFVCTRYFDFKTNEWSHGNYFETEKEAKEWFIDAIKED